MLKKLKQSLTNLSIWTKRFLFSIPYSKIFMLITELGILSLILLAIYLIIFDTTTYLDLLKYNAAIMWLFALGYAIYKKE